MRAGNWQESADTPTMPCKSMILLQEACEVKLYYLKTELKFANKHNSVFGF